MQPLRWGLLIMAIIWMMIIVPLSAVAAPYAALVMDARSGEVLHTQNADTRLHPASLTKMMTLYIAFEAIENGEISLETPVRISKFVASEPPSKLGLRVGQTIAFRYLVRAAAVKSANDAATAIGEALEGSEARFARRMNRTAKALGMTRTTFKNAHGLTERGHLSTARDMTTLGRHLFYDYPQYYNLFSRLTTDAGIKQVSHTNARMLKSYKGADGIKTGYTRAAGFNLTASAERNGERIIATVFGGKSTTSRNAKVAELLDLGFRKAPRRVAIHKPAKPPYLGKIGGSAPVSVADGSVAGGVGKTVRLASAAAVRKSLRPQLRPVPDAPVLVASAEDIEKALQVANVAESIVAATTVAPKARPEIGVQTVESATADSAEGVQAAEVVVAQAGLLSLGKKPAPPSMPPEARPETLVLASLPSGQQIAPRTATDRAVLAAIKAPVKNPVQEVVTRVSTSGGRYWGVNVGRYPSEYKARKVLLSVALDEMSTLEGTLRKVVRRKGGFEANFMGMTQEQADLACRRLEAKHLECQPLGPS